MRLTRFAKSMLVLAVLGSLSSVVRAAYTWSAIEPAQTVLPNPATQVAQPVAYKAICAAAVGDPAFSGGYIVFAPSMGGTDTPDFGYPKILGRNLEFLGKVAWNPNLKVGSEGSITFVASTMGATKSQVTTFVTK